MWALRQEFEKLESILHRFPDPSDTVTVASLNAHVTGTTRRWPAPTVTVRLMLAVLSCPNDMLCTNVGATGAPPSSPARSIAASRPSTVVPPSGRSAPTHWSAYPSPANRP